MSQLLENELYLNDLKQAARSISNKSKLQNAKVLVTGASGLIGSAIIDLLLTIDPSIKIYAAGRNREVIENRFQNKVTFVPYDAVKPVDFPTDIDYLFHAASNASPDLYVKDPVGTMQANFLGMNNLLLFCKEHPVKKAVYVSSSEIYGKIAKDQPIKETDLGIIDSMNVRSSYSESKKATETLCLSYASQYDIPVCIARPGHIYGPSFKKSDKRVGSDFLQKGIDNQTIELLSDGSQIRSYCYTPDCASALIHLALNGESKEAYNIANKDSNRSIYELAKIISEKAGVPLKAPETAGKPSAQFNPMQNSTLNPKKLEETGWKPCFGFDEGIGHSLEILKDTDRLPQTTTNKD